MEALGKPIREPCDRCGKLHVLSHKLKFVKLRSTHAATGTAQMPSPALCPRCVRAVVEFIWPGLSDWEKVFV